MTSKLTYLGPLAEVRGAVLRKPWVRRVPWLFVLIVCVPTLIAMAYYFVIAAPQYVSEAKFVVRQPTSDRPSSFGVALQGVGLSSEQTDAFSVHEYIMSRDGLADLSRRVDIRAALQRPGADFLARYPRIWEDDSQEDLHKALGRFVTVGYDSKTGLSILRVKAFRAADAQQIANALLGNGEVLVNRLNDRAATDAVTEGQRTVTEARMRLAAAQEGLSNFRSREEFVDPQSAARLSSEVIGNLMGAVANLKAERAQISAEASSSPQLPSIDNRIRALEGQIELEKGKIAGAPTSLAPKIGMYETLVLEREFADRELVAANAALESAKMQARRQRLYLDRVVSPALPDKPTEPRRLLAVLAVLASSLVLFGIVWLLRVGFSEHSQE